MKTWRPARRRSSRSSAPTALRRRRAPRSARRSLICSGPCRALASSTAGAAGHVPPPLAVPAVLSSAPAPGVCSLSSVSLLLFHVRSATGVSDVQNLVRFDLPLFAVRASFLPLQPWSACAEPLTFASSRLCRPSWSGWVSGAPALSSTSECSILRPVLRRTLT